MIWGWFRGLLSGIQEADYRSYKEPKAEISCGWYFPPKPETSVCVSIVAGEALSVRRGQVPPSTRPSVAYS